MSKSTAVSAHQKQLHDDVQAAVKSIMAAPTALKTSDYSKVLTSTLAATQKSVKIQIASGDLTTLKQSGYKLCFAKKVGTEAYNVVWQSYVAYLSNSTFSWTPQYQLFGSNSFQANVQVDVSTNIVNIGLGQQSVLDTLRPAGFGDERWTRYVYYPDKQLRSHSPGHQPIVHRHRWQTGQHADLRGFQSDRHRIHGVDPGRNHLGVVRAERADQHHVQYLALSIRRNRPDLRQQCHPPLLRRQLDRRVTRHPGRPCGCPAFSSVTVAPGEIPGQ